MSKIEKALRRARGDQKAIVVTPRQESAAPMPAPAHAPAHAPATAVNELGGQMLASATQAAPLMEVEVRARSSAAIALMREAELLDISALARYRIIHPEMAEDNTVQAFREIRTKILQKTMGRNCIIMVTGATLGSGSTFVSLNLSAAFAFDAGKTALLIDCNLRDPSLHRLFPGDNVVGLIDYLENADMDIARIIQPVGIERLRVIPAGGNREIPAEYFTSQKTKRLLEGVRQRYPERFIVLDAPPMTESADTQILAELCDYVLLVVPYGKVSDAQVGSCIKAIDSKKLLGVIFNNEPRVPALPWKEVLRAPLDIGRQAIAWLKNIKKKS